MVLKSYEQVRLLNTLKRDLPHLNEGILEIATRNKKRKKPMVLINYSDRYKGINEYANGEKLSLNWVGALANDVNSKVE